MPAPPSSHVRATAGAWRWDLQTALAQRGVLSSVCRSAVLAHSVVVLIACNHHEGYSDSYDQERVRELEHSAVDLLMRAAQSRGATAHQGDGQDFGAERASRSAMIRSGPALETQTLRFYWITGFCIGPDSLAAGLRHSFSG